MTSDPAFHFPPDVFSAIVDAVPLLTRGKKEVLTFFQGCGVTAVRLQPLLAQIANDPKLSKYEITRELLTELNAQGDAGLSARRQVIRRIAEFEDFASCYPDNQLKAQGAVARVRQLVNTKDAFTRIQHAHEEESRQHRDVQEIALRKANARRAEIARVRDDLYALFRNGDPHQRGKALEGILNRLFQVHELLVREAFVVTGGEKGVLEQIDGAIELDGTIYLVEMKWWDHKLGRSEVANHLVSVYGRAGVGGIFISASGYHGSAIEVVKSALAERVIALVELEEIVAVLDRDRSLTEMLRAKIREAKLNKRPLWRESS
jgi:restriction system protein